MACLQKIGVDYIFGCPTTNHPQGSLGKYDEALLINQSDIESFSTSNVWGVTMVLKRGARGYVVTGVNNSIKVSIAKKGGDVYPNMFDPSIIMTIPRISLSTPQGMASDQCNANLVIALKGTNGITVFGLGAPLSCIDFEGDSTAGEFLSVTYGVEESQSGSTMYRTNPTEYEKWKAVAE